MEKEHLIIGDGISGYIIAACLDYNGISNFKIYGNNSYKPQNILLLKYNDNEELQHYFYIFGIEYNRSNIHKYTKKINIGYMNDTEIIDTPSSEMISNYYSKQNRLSTQSGMSDGKNSFNAIMLDKVYLKLKKDYENKTVYCNIHDTFIDYLKEQHNVKVYNTILPTECNNYKPEVEYIEIIENVECFNYDYIYDCRLNSLSKRLCSNCTEYISKPEDKKVIEIKNYYHSPMIYNTFNAKTNSNWIDISRNATKTQLKQEDIINYMINESGNYEQ